MERHTLDWILEEQQIHEDGIVKYDKYGLHFGEHDQQGRVIKIIEPGNLSIGYFYYFKYNTPGKFIAIGSDGVLSVGETNWEDAKRRRRETEYLPDGTIGSSNYTAPAMALFENSNTDYDDFQRDLEFQQPNEEVKE